MAPPSPYTPELKAKVLAYYEQHGAAAAGREFDVPVGTVKAWAHRNGNATVAIANTQEATLQARAKLELQRTHIILGFADLTLHMQERAMEEEKGTQAQAWTTSAAISADKLQLLTGGATSRHEHGESEINREMRSLLHKREAIAREGEAHTPETIDCESTEVEALSN